MDIYRTDVGNSRAETVCESNISLRVDLDEDKLISAMREKLKGKKPYRAFELKRTHRGIYLLRYADTPGAREELLRAMSEIERDVENAIKIRNSLRMIYQEEEGS